jgi:hypothetical protein
MSVSKISLLQSVAAAFFIIWTLGSLGALLDQKKLAYWSETFRWIVFLSALVWILKG